MDQYWVYYAILGAFIYGTFSFLLSYIDKNLKNDLMAQLGLGFVVNVASIPFYISAFYIWHLLNPGKIPILLKNIKWVVIFLVILLDLMTSPIHSLVINTGGSLGQQSMYSLTIIPLLILNYLIFNERLNRIQWLGILIAIIATSLMYE